MYVPIYSPFLLQELINIYVYINWSIYCSPCQIDILQEYQIYTYVHLLEITYMQDPDSSNLRLVNRAIHTYIHIHTCMQSTVGIYGGLGRVIHSNMTSPKPPLYTNMFLPLLLSLPGVSYSQPSLKVFHAPLCKLSHRPDFKRYSHQENSEEKVQGFGKPHG